MKTALKHMLVVVISCMILITCSCQRQPRKVQSRKPLGQQEIIIGLIPEQNVFRQRERYQLLQKYLSDRIGINVNYTSLSRYGNILEQFDKDRLDGAFFGSFTYSLAHSQIGVEAIARPVNLDGTSTYHGYIFTRRDSHIRTPADMKKKRFAFVEYATMAGYLFPLAYFRSNGVTDPHSYLGEIYFTGSHDAAILAVLNKEADIGAAKNTIYDQMAAENPRIEKELVILATSGVVPQNCLAVRKDLAPEIKSALRQALLSMDKDPEGAEVLRRFGARGFIETNDKDYGYLFRLAAKVGIDLKTYRYNNR